MGLYERTRFIKRPFPASSGGGDSQGYPTTEIDGLSVRTGPPQTFEVQILK